jgi:hypothetical protein
MIKRFCSLSKRLNEGLIAVKEQPKGIDFKDIKLYNKLRVWSRYCIHSEVAFLEENLGSRNDRNRFGIM